MPPNTRRTIPSGLADGGSGRPPRIAEALHELDELGLETLELGRPAVLLAADAVERDHVSARDAAYLVVARLLGARLATLDRRLAAAAGPLGVLLAGESEHGPRELVEPYGAPGVAAAAAAGAARPSSLPDYAGLGAYLGELRRRALAGLP
jgi:hypothetical protein